MESRSHINRRFALVFWIPLIILIFVIIPRYTYAISPEYISSILAANGVVFGFWSIIIGLKSDILKWFVHPLEPMFFISLGFLVFSAFLVGALALNYLQPAFVLFFVVSGFYLTCCYLGLTLYYMVFKWNSDSSKV